MRTLRILALATLVGAPAFGADDASIAAAVNGLVGEIASLSQTLSVAHPKLGDRELCLNVGILQSKVNLAEALVEAHRWPELAGLAGRIGSLVDGFADQDFCPANDGPVNRAALENFMDRAHDLAVRAEPTLVTLK